jgi:hypothetical protein
VASTDVTVCIPTIPPRAKLLVRAVQSVLDQTLPASAIAVVRDDTRDGAWKTRGKALDMVRTPYVAFLDDDDELKDEHLELLMQTLIDTGADYAYSHYDTMFTRGRDPHLGNLGKPFDPTAPCATTMTVLVRTDLAQAVGFTPPPSVQDVVGGEDHRFTLDCVAAGAKIVHVPARTWYWHWDRLGTRGQGRKWDSGLQQEVDAW